MSVHGNPRIEYRAVFSYPPSILGPTRDTYGPPRDSIEEAIADRPAGSEENHGWRTGIQSRLVTDWRLVR